VSVMNYSQGAQGIRQTRGRGPIGELFAISLISHRLGSTLRPVRDGEDNDGDRLKDAVGRGCTGLFSGHTERGRSWPRIMCGWHHTIGWRHGCRRPDCTPGAELHHRLLEWACQAAIPTFLTL
jgi:hypothetical protein